MGRRMLVALVLAAASAIAAPAAGAAQFEFGPPQPLLSDEANYGLKVVDVNGDGLPDVVLRNGSPPMVRVQYGRNDGTLAPPVDTPLASDPTDLVVGDVNGDGLRDVVLPAGLGVAIAIADGAGSFTVSSVDMFPPPDITHPIGYGYVDHVALGDLDADGLPEIVATPRPNSGYPPEYRDDFTTPQNLAVIEWTPSGPALVPQTNTTWAGTSPRAVRVVDMDGDGRLDVVVGTWADVRVIFGSGIDDIGAWPAPIGYPAGDAGSELEVGDLNGDGRPDLVGWNGAIAAWLNAGRSLVPINTAPNSMPNAGRGANALADLDLDGVLDLALAWESWTHDASAIQLFHGRGDGTFVPFQPAGAPADASSPVTIPLQRSGLFTFDLGDVNGDARADLVVGEAGVFPNLTPYPPPGATTGTATAIALTAATISGRGTPRAGRAAFAHLEYGPTTAYGLSTPEVALGTAPAGQDVSARVPSLVPGTTYHYRIVLRTSAGGSAVGEDATFTTRDGVRLASARFDVGYRVSKARGTLTLAGSAPAEGAHLIATLERRSGQQVRPVKSYRLTLGSGSFTRRLAVPASTLPGTYRVTLAGTVGVETPPPTSIDAVLAPPPQGVVGAAWASARSGGPARTRIAGRPRAVFARFAFATRPTTGTITTRWTYPDGTHGATVRRERGGQVSAAIRSRTPLPHGHYRCELRVGRTLVGVVDVRLG